MRASSNNAAATKAWEGPHQTSLDFFQLVFPRDDNKRWVSPADPHLNFMFKQHRSVPVFIGGLLETRCPVNHTVTAEANAPQNIHAVSGPSFVQHRPRARSQRVGVTMVFRCFRLSRGVPLYRRKYWKHQETQTVHFITFVWTLLLDISLRS